VQFGIVKGTVVASQKVEDLRGHPLKLMIACDDQRRPVGEPFVAIDPVSARPGDFVMWVGKRDASLAIPGASLSNNYPVDAAITGIIDAVS
jgi:microcompartment protein CcmK/EutM